VSSTLLLTDRDRSKLDVLTRKVRALSLRQVADHYYDGERANARRRLRQLVAAGLLVRATVIARPLPVLLGPVVVWQPGEPAPAAGVVSNQLKARWQNRPARACRVVLATAHAAHLTGGRASGQLPRDTQATHDLGVAAVYLHFRRTDARRAAAWRGEDVMAATRQGQKCPDAFLVDAAGTVQAVVEFGGAYDPDRVRAFHLDCADRGLPYEVW
jgi:hypothetical protein